MNAEKKQNMLRSRRGITMVEVLIALVLIAMISAATVSMILRSVDVEKKTVMAVETANCAENALTCFRFAKNEQEFFSALQKTGPYEKAEDGTCVLNGRNFTVTVYADYTLNSLSFRAVDEEGEKIYSYLYPRLAHDTTVDTSGYTDPDTKNNWDLVAYAMDAYEKGWGYVWGTYGQVLTEGLLESKIDQYPEEVGGKADFIQEAWLGGRTADCVGLIKGYCWLNPHTKEIGYAINGMNDLNADQLYYSAAAENTGTIDTIPEIPGLAVWFEGHIGIYIGDGKVIHAQGTQKGVVCTTFDEYDAWTNWMYIPSLTYTDAPGATPEGGAS